MRIFLLLTLAAGALVSTPACAQFSAGTAFFGYQPQPLRLTGTTPGTGALYYVGSGTVQARRLNPATTATAGSFSINTLGYAVVADADADGQDDVLIVNPSSTGTGSTIQVYYQQAGAFALGATISLGTTFFPTGGVAVADLNQDGRPDVVASNSNSSATPISNNILATVLGTGQRSFDAPVFTSRPHTSGVYTVQRLLVTDLTVDGKPDVVVLYTYQLGNGNGTGVAGLGVSPGTGTGSLSTEQLLNLNGTASGTVTQPYVAVADFDRDGRPDVAFADRSGPTAPPYSLNLYVAAGSAAAGSNLLAAPVLRGTYPSASGNLAVAGLGVADFDNDTYPDVAVNLTGLLVVARVAGTRAGQSYGSGYAGGNLSGMPVALDLNGDAYLDALVTQNSSNVLPLLSTAPLAAAQAAGAAGGLYPNPSAGVVTVEGAADVTVRDVRGQLVPARRLPGGQLQLEQPGLYLVEWPAAAGAAPRREKLVVR